MRFRAGSILTTPMVIGLMAFAIVGFLLLVDTAVFPPKNTSPKAHRNTATVNQNANTNTAGTTEGTFLTNDNTNASDDAGAAE